MYKKEHNKLFKPYGINIVRLFGLTYQNTMRQNQTHASILVIFNYFYGLKSKLMIFIL